MQTEVTAEAEAPAVADPRGPRRVARIDWIFGALLVIASLLVGIVQVGDHRAISPIDEYVYIDYLAKVPSQGIVRGGEHTGDYARESLACRGVRLIGQYLASLCRTADSSPDSAFPTAGTNSADIYTPIYFAVTWVLAQPFQWLGVHDLTDAGRLTGWIWLAAAAVLLYLSLRRLKVGPLLSFGLGMLMVGSLPAMWSNTYVSTDAPALLAGAAMLWGILRFEDGRRFGLLVLTVACVGTGWAAVPAGVPPVNPHAGPVGTATMHGDSESSDTTPYAGPGATIGPALTFGYLAAETIALESRKES